MMIVQASEEPKKIHLIFSSLQLFLLSMPPELQMEAAMLDAVVSCWSSGTYRTRASYAFGNQPSI